MQKYYSTKTCGVLQSRMPLILIMDKLHLVMKQSGKEQTEALILLSYGYIFLSPIQSITFTNSSRLIIIIVVFYKRTLSGIPDDHKDTG